MKELKTLHAIDQSAPSTNHVALSINRSMGLGQAGLIAMGQVASTLYLETGRNSAEPNSSVVADLRIGDRWFDPRLGQYSED